MLISCKIKRGEREKTNAVILLFNHLSDNIDKLQHQNSAQRCMVLLTYGIN